MAELRSYGWVVNDLEPKKSVRQKLYVRFSMVERVGFGEAAHTQYYDVWAWEQTAQSLIDRGVTKGSRIWIRGSLELVDYTKRDGVTKDKCLKLKLYEWRDVQKDGHGQPVDAQAKEKSASQDPKAPGPAAVVDGDREALPE